MESKVNYTLVGIFMLLLLTGIMVTMLWLSSGIETQDYLTYQVYMNESVAGLSKNAPVKYNGVDVGFVSGIQLNLANPQQVILTLKIGPSIPITTNTQAVLTEQGITGIAYIGLRGGNHAATLEIKPGQKYPVIRSAPSFLVRLDTTLQSLTGNINSLSKNVKSLLSEQNMRSLQKTLDDIAIITGTVSKNSAAISSSIKAMDVTLKNTAVASRQFSGLINNVNNTTKVVRAMAKTISNASKTIKSTFTQGKIAIQTISNQLVPNAYTTLENMQVITENLRGLSSELKQNPSILLRGKTPAKPGPGE